MTPNRDRRWEPALEPKSAPASRRTDEVVPAASAGVLYADGSGGDVRSPALQPDFFVDLGLDQIVRAITADRAEYELSTFFWQSLQSLEEVAFRHAVIEDLQAPVLRRALNDFAAALRTVRRDFGSAGAFEHPYQKWRVRLDAANLYWATVTKLDAELGSVAMSSRGMIRLRDYVRAYVSSPLFAREQNEGEQIGEALSQIRYDVVVRGLRIEVRDSAREADYGELVRRTFASFEAAAEREYRFSIDQSKYLSWVDGKILSIVGDIYREPFDRLERYCRYRDKIVDDSIARFDRELQFYLSYLDYIDRLKSRDLDFCLPVVDAAGADTDGRAVFDLALAAKLAPKARPVCNDFHLTRPERAIVVTGPNQGGKTTFARAFGQLHFLASLGLPVPAAAARLPLADRVFTHFERVEHMGSLRGKLQDDLIRAHTILQNASAQSIVIVNEIFASTTLSDAVWLSGKIAARVVGLDALCVWVTFIDDVVDFSDTFVSMVAKIDPASPTTRTFVVQRQPPVGLAYAMSVAEKHRLDYRSVRERLHA
jgi:DNA mismatch repair protein MutS